MNEMGDAAIFDGWDVSFAPAGEPFQTPRRVVDSKLYYGEGYDIGLGLDGDFGAVWASSTADGAAYEVGGVTGTIDGPLRHQTLAPSSKSKKTCPEIASGPFGHMAAFWQESGCGGSSIAISRRLPGQPFGETERVPGPASWSHPSLEVDGLGRAVVGYSDMYSTGRLATAAADSVFSEPKAAVTGEVKKLALAPSGSGVLAYQPFDGAVVAGRVAEDGSVTAPERIAPYWSYVLDLETAPTGQSAALVSGWRNRGKGEYYMDLIYDGEGGEPAPPAVMVGAGGASEKYTWQSFRVKRVPAVGETTVRYSLVDGTAKSPDDFVKSTGVVSFADGEDTKWITLRLVDDKVQEPEEHFSIVLSEPVNGVIDPWDDTFEVTDDDDPVPPGDEPPPSEEPPPTPPPSEEPPPPPPGEDPPPPAGEDPPEGDPPPPPGGDPPPAPPPPPDAPPPDFPAPPPLDIKPPASTPSPPVGGPGAVQPAEGAGARKSKKARKRARRKARRALQRAVSF
jgi:hypothetical protein